MNDKSHVSLEQHICQVCGTTFDTGNILLDKRLRASMSHHTTTGWGLCSEHQKMFSEGFVALIEFDPARSGNPRGGESLDLKDAYRTGRLAHIKRTAFNAIFNVALGENQTCVFAEPGVIERLQKMVNSNPD